MTTKFFFIALATVAVLSFGAMAMAHSNGYGYGHMNGNGRFGGHMMGYNQTGPGYGTCPAWNARGNAVMPHAGYGAWNGASAATGTATLPDFNEAR